MVYYMGALMGYFLGTNAKYERKARWFGASLYPNRATGLFSSLGLFVGWTAIIPAVYCVSAASGNSWLEGTYFSLAVLDGALFAWLFEIAALSSTFSAMTFFTNVALALGVYLLTQTS